MDSPNRFPPLKVSSPQVMEQQLRIPVNMIRNVPSHMGRFHVSVIRGPEQGSRPLQGVAGSNFIPLQSMDLDRRQLIGVMQIQQRAMAQQSYFNRIRSSNVAQISGTCFNQGVTNSCAPMGGSLILTTSPHMVALRSQLHEQHPQPPQCDQISRLIHRSPEIIVRSASIQRGNASPQVPIVRLPASAARGAQQTTFVAPDTLSLPPQIATMSSVTQGEIPESLKPLVHNLSGLPHDGEQILRPPHHYHLRPPSFSIKPRFHAQYPIGTHFLGSNTGISNQQFIVGTARIPLVVRPSKGPQTPQLRFHQLPGLNFNHAQTLQSNDSLNEQDESAGTAKPLSGGPTRKRKASSSFENQNVSDPSVTSISSKGHEMAHVKRVVRTANAKKIKVQQLNISEINHGDIKDLRTTQKLALKPEDTGNQKHESFHDTSFKHPYNPPTMMKTGALSCTTPIASAKSPAQILIHVDIRKALTVSVFKKGVKITVDNRRCSAAGVYVFDVHVLEKNETSDYPPLKMQVTEDYPGELPVFLDLYEISHSINSKKIRPRFEEAVRIFRNNLIKLEEKYYRIHYLIYLWSQSLMEMSIRLQGNVNPKSQRRREASTKKQRQ